VGSTPTSGIRYAATGYGESLRRVLFGEIGQPSNNLPRMILDTDWLLEKAAERAGQFTVPILVNQGSPQQHGTGTLVRLADHFFLVSAAHVLLPALEHKIPLYLGAGKSLPLRTKDFVYTTEKQPHHGGCDPYDIVVWRLEDALVSSLGTGRFLDQTDLEPSPDLSGGIFLVFGYPSEWSALAQADPKTIEQAPIGLLTAPYAGSVQFDGYDPEINILLNYGVDITPGAGNDHPLPSQLGGISGCSIWKLHNEQNDKASWNPNDVKVVGIQTGRCRKAPALKGTTWLYVLGMIAKQWPGLAPCMQLSLPRSVLVQL
jgi:hypothetical protein